MTDHHAIKDGEAVCTAPDGAFCRLECPAQTCEEWSAPGCEHGPLAPAPQCLAAEWVNAAGLRDTGPDDIPDGYEGPITITWGHGGEGYIWAPATGDPR